MERLIKNKLGQWTIETFDYLIKTWTKSDKDNDPHFQYYIKYGHVNPNDINGAVDHPLFDWNKNRGLVAHNRSPIVQETLKTKLKR